MWCQKLFLFLLFVLAINAKKPSKSLIEEISEHKEFKKFLKTRNNILVYFYSSKIPTEISEIIKKVSESTKGLATLVTIDCSSSDGKKLCKKVKASKGDMKHYKSGEFHKDYDRLMTVASMDTFLRDPTGDAPWEEDEGAKNVLFLNDAKSFASALKKDKKGMMIMFYAPWCGFCKKMKPDYQNGATEVKDNAVMAALDVTKPTNNAISKKYNVTGFPTLIYFEGGKQKFVYEGENKQKAIVDFLRTPFPRTKESIASSAPEEEKPWKDEPSKVVHLTDDSFDEFLAEEESVLVMFYAPWCGHCKRMKPEFVKAAESMVTMNINGKLAAVDATKESKLGKRFEVKGYPTVKYFKKGEFSFDAGTARKEKEIVDFMKDPKEPPPPPPPEAPWSEEESEVVHLNEESFKPFLKKRKHVLVMFYAPWCGHCKKAKPEITAAAEEFKESSKHEFAAVDCTIERTICNLYDVKGFPTFIYFNYYKEKKDYDGGRTKKDFIAFMKDPENPQKFEAPPPEDHWAGKEGNEFVRHLKTTDFDTTLSTKEHGLVMFYAPWCGHCKAMIGDYAAAAKQLNEDTALQSASFVVAAVDATAEREIGNKFDVSGYPTLKYLRYGKKAQDYDGGRKKKDLVDFMVKKMRMHRNEL